MTSLKNGKVEMLRFIFCICVVLFHAGADVFGKDRSIGAYFTFFGHGRTGVEFFFLLSGFLAAKSAYNLKNNSSLGENTFNFILKKMKTIFPYHIFAIALTVILLMRYSNNFIADLAKRLPSIFFLQRTGISGVDFISVEWYICSMLLALAIIYPMLLKNFDLTAKVIAPVLSSLLIGYLAKTYGAMPPSNEFVTFTYSCNIRGFAIVLLGCFCFVIAQKIRKYEFSFIQKLFLVFLENLCWIVSVFYLVSGLNRKCEAYVIYILALGITLVFCRDFSRGLYNNKIVFYLGKLSLPIYICQNIGRDIIKNELDFLSRPLKIMLILLFAVIIGFISNLVCGKIRRMRLNNYVSK